MEKNEDKVMTFANGQKELHTKQFRVSDFCILFDIVGHGTVKEY